MYHIEYRGVCLGEEDLAFIEKTFFIHEHEAIRAIEELAQKSTLEYIRYLNCLDGCPNKPIDDFEDQYKVELKRYKFAKIF